MDLSKKNNVPKILENIFPARLRMLRAHRGWSTRELGKMLGKCHQFVAKLELGPKKGGAKPSMDTVEDLGRVFGVRPAYFLEDNPLVGSQMPLDVLLKNYDNDVRDLLEKQLTTSHLRLIKQIFDANLTEEQVQLLLTLLKR